MLFLNNVRPRRAVTAAECRRGHVVSWGHVWSMIDKVEGPGYLRRRVTVGANEITCPVPGCGLYMEPKHRSSK